MRFVLPSLVDAHLPAPASPHCAPHCARATPGQPCQTQPGPAQPQTPLLHHQPQEYQAFHLLCCDISNFDPESERSSHKTQHTQSRPSAPIHTCPRPSASPCTRSRPRFKIVCCDIWICNRVWDPICEISQHSTCQTTEIPNHRSVTWFTNQFDAPQPPGMCAAILPVLAPDSPPGGRYRSTHPWTTGFAAHMGEYCAAISQISTLNPGAHPTKRSTLLPEGRSDSGAGRFEPGGRR